MLLRKLQSPRTAIPSGMLLVCAGMLLNVTAQGFIQHVHGSAHWSTGRVDFVRGFCIGLGIALEIGGMLVMAPTARAKWRRSDASVPPQS